MSAGFTSSDFREVTLSLMIKVPVLAPLWASGTLLHPQRLPQDFCRFPEDKTSLSGVIFGLRVFMLDLV